MAVEIDRLRVSMSYFDSIFAATIFLRSFSIFSSEFSWLKVSFCILSCVTGWVPESNCSWYFRFIAWVPVFVSTYPWGRTSPFGRFSDFGFGRWWVWGDTPWLDDEMGTCCFFGVYFVCYFFFEEVDSVLDVLEAVFGKVLKFRLGQQSYFLLDLMVFEGSWTCHFFHI